MEINKTDDETLKKIAAEIRVTGVAKKKTPNREKLSFLQKLEKSVISPNHKEVIQRMMGVKEKPVIKDKSTPSEEIGIFPASSDVVRQEVKKYDEFLNSSFYNEIVSVAVENDTLSAEKEQVTYTDSLSEQVKNDTSYRMGTKKED